MISGRSFAADEAEIYATSNSRPLTIKLHKGQTVWKGPLGSGLTVIHPGDELILRGKTDADGTFVPSDIWCNITALSGRISAVSADAVSFMAAEPQAVTPRRVVLTAKTLSECEGVTDGSALVVGRAVQVVGVATTDGAILATRVILFAAKP